MATLSIDGDALHVHLSTWENIGGLTASFSVPFVRISDVSVAEDPWKIVRGMRVGTGFPWVVLLGTMIRRGPNDFVAIYRRRPAIVVSLVPGAAYGRLIVTIPDAATFAESLRRAARITGDGIHAVPGERTPPL